MPRAKVDSSYTAAQRLANDAKLKPIVDRLRGTYPVTVESKIIGGVQTDIFRPKEGVPAENGHRVLINLHGGGFVGGGPFVRQLESVAVSSLGHVKVVAVEYRLAPEYKFPAASEDVAAVYKALLSEYKPENIGIYGCSAGGILTAQAVAWFQKQGLPRPGAIGILCAGGIAGVLGDSLYMAAVLGGRPMPSVPAPRLGMDVLELYFENVHLKDPLVSPAYSLDTLAKFPPTLLITGSRDANMSAAIFTHTQLVKAGADAQLYVWEGAGHGSFVVNDEPESLEALNVITKFFRMNLGAAVPSKAPSH